MTRPTIVDELVNSNIGYDEADLISALWDLYIAVKDDHSGRHFEGECPQCVAVKSIERLSREHP